MDLFFMFLDLIWLFIILCFIYVFVNCDGVDIVIFIYNNFKIKLIKIINYIGICLKRIF